MTKQMHVGVGAVAIFSFGMIGSASAVTRTTKPFLDYKGDVVQSSIPNGGGIQTSSTWETVWGTPHVAPTFGAPATIYPFPLNPLPAAPYGFAINTFTDYIILHNANTNLANSAARFVAAAEFLTYDDAATVSGLMTATTIYGLDAAPTTPGQLSLAGFNTNAVFPDLRDETITGPSGAVYPATSGQLVQLSNLAATLGSGFDVSFINGSGVDSVYVFQTPVPFAEAAIPEPTSLALALGGTAALLGRRRRSIAR